MAPSPSRAAAASIQELLDEKLPEEIRPEQGFARWFEPLRQRAMIAVSEVHETVTRRLGDERAKVLKEEGVPRRVWEVTGTDGRSLLKPATSARSKIGRELQSRQSAGRLLDGRLSLDQIEQMLLSFPDLGRFRIVCDFSLDVDRAKKVLLTRKPLALLGRYPIVDRPKDYVNDPDLRRPTRGHRAYQLAVRVPGEGFRVEIQWMTQLQAAWDLRNHPMYEWSREGGQVPATLSLQDVMLAETLHLVDLQATRNYKEFLRVCRRGR
jgi:ppGpp synthetase/RelA/SpoT-type nucleotidyltranferase